MLSWLFSCRPSFLASLSSPPFSARASSSPLSWRVFLRPASTRVSARAPLLPALHPQSPARLPLPRSLRPRRPAPRPPAGIVRCRLQNRPSRYPFHPPVGESLGPGKKRAQKSLFWPELSRMPPRPCAVVIALAGSCQALCGFLARGQPKQPHLAGAGARGRAVGQRSAPRKLFIINDLVAV